MQLLYNPCVIKLGFKINTLPLLLNDQLTRTLLFMFAKILTPLSLYLPGQGCHQQAKKKIIMPHGLDDWYPYDVTHPVLGIAMLDG